MRDDLISDRAAVDQAAADAICNRRGQLGCLRR